MNRQLSELEHAAWILDQGIPQNFVMLARVSGTLSEPVLREALDMVQERHPPLKCKIKEGRPPEYVSENVPKIPLQVMERKDENQWIEFAEKEIMEPFPFTEGPLVRVIQLASQNKCDLIVTFCHIIADATSGVNFINNLLRIAEKLARGIKPDAEPTLPVLPSSLELLRKDLKFKPEFLDIAGRFNRTIHKPVELPGDEESPPEKRITRIIQKILSPEDTKRLASRSKENRNSVHGALCAAFLQAVVEQIRKTQELPKKGPFMVGCLTPVNMRPLFSRPVKEEIGDYISHALHTQLIDENVSIWAAAKNVKKSIERELKFRRDIKETRGIGELLKVFKTPEEMVTGLIDAFPPVAVTNMGRLDIPEQFGELKLEEIHYAVSINPACKNGFAVAVTTHRGHMTLNYLYSEPYLSEKTANTMVESTMNRLKEAIA